MESYHLKDDDYRQLIALSRQGDIKARQIAIEGSLWMINPILKKYSGSVDEDDLYAEGMIGVIKAVDAWDPKSPHRFGSYAYSAIRNRMLTAVDKEIKANGKKYGKDCQGLKDSEGDDTELEDIIADPIEVEKITETRIISEDIMKAVSTLSQRDQAAIYMRFGLNGQSRTTLHKIAQSQGRTAKSEGHRMVQSAINHLKASPLLKKYFA